MQELDTLFDLRNYPFLVKLISEDFCYYGENEIALLLEKYDTDLKKYCQTFDNDNLHEYIVWKLIIIMAVTRATTRLHDLGYIHRDLKTANILIKGDFTVVLNDFGFTKRINSFKRLIHMNSIDSYRKIGTPLFMGKEIEENQIYYKETDIYSLGVSLFFIFNNIKQNFTKVDEFKNYFTNYCSEEIDTYDSINYDNFFVPKKINNILENLFINENYFVLNQNRMEDDITPFNDQGDKGKFICRK